MNKAARKGCLNLYIQDDIPDFCKDKVNREINS
jgi:hypothetical protein